MPDIARMVLTRRQTPEKLFEAEGRLPMLVLSGTKDKQVRGDVVVKEMSPHFKDMKVVMIRRPVVREAGRNSDSSAGVRRACLQEHHVAD